MHLLRDMDEINGALSIERKHAAIFLWYSNNHYECLLPTHLDLISDDSTSASTATDPTPASMDSTTDQAASRTKPTTRSQCEQRQEATEHDQDGPGRTNNALMPQPDPTDGTTTSAALRHRFDQLFAAYEQGEDLMATDATWRELLHPSLDAQMHHIAKASGRDLDLVLPAWQRDRDRYDQGLIPTPPHLDETALRPPAELEYLLTGIGGHLSGATATVDYQTNDLHDWVEQQLGPDARHITSLAGLLSSRYVTQRLRTAVDYWTRDVARLANPALLLESMPWAKTVEWMQALGHYLKAAALGRARGAGPLPPQLETWIDGLTHSHTYEGWMIQLNDKTKWQQLIQAVDSEQRTRLAPYADYDEVMYCGASAVTLSVHHLWSVPSLATPAFESCTREGAWCSDIHAVLTSRRWSVAAHQAQDRPRPPPAQDTVATPSAATFRPAVPSSGGQQTV